MHSSREDTEAKSRTKELRVWFASTDDCDGRGYTLKRQTRTEGYFDACSPHARRLHEWRIPKEAGTDRRRLTTKVTRAATLVFVRGEMGMEGVS